MSTTPESSDPEMKSFRTPNHPLDSDHAVRVADLFLKYHGKLVKSLVARTHSLDEARDIASQAFVEVLAQRSGTVSFLGAYLYRTAHNITLNRLIHDTMRKRKEPLLGYDSRTPPSPEHLTAEQERGAALKRSIDELPPRLRMALVLRMWDDLSCEEIVSRFAKTGVVLSTRTVERYVADALDLCRQAVSTDDPQGKGAK
jgi:RNA polymerase sigma factor (sigma-70 family)